MRTHWTQRGVKVNNTLIHCFRTGRGEKRPLLLVHGFSDNGLCWAPVARELESDYDVIMPDMRGHGLSARARPGDVVDLAADLAGLIRDLGLRRPIVCGHSMGAMASYELAVRFPGLVAALVLEDPPWWLSPPFPAAPDGHAAGIPILEWARDLSNHTLEDLLAGYRRDHPAWPEELIRAMSESKKQLDPAIVDILGAALRSAKAGWLETIANFTRPLLLIAADPALGGIVTPEVVKEVRDLNPRVTVVVVPGAGHLIRFDNFPAFMDGLRSFLKSLPE